MNLAIDFLLAIALYLGYGLLINNKFLKETVMTLYGIKYPTKVSNRQKAKQMNITLINTLIFHSCLIGVIVWNFTYFTQPYKTNPTIILGIFYLFYFIDLYLNDSWVYIKNIYFWSRPINTFVFTTVLFLVFPVNPKYNSFYAIYFDNPPRNDNIYYYNV
jgi:hypothetical protein